MLRVCCCTVRTPHLVVALQLEMALQLVMAIGPVVSGCVVRTFPFLWVAMRAATAPTG